MSLMFEPLRKYATFSGRATRSEYWLFWLFTFIVQVVGWGLTGGFAAAYGNPLAVGPLTVVYCLLLLGLFVPSIAVSFRRLHDTDRSAWWLLIAFLPIIGAIVLLVFFLLDGTNGPNRFGEDPKAPLVELTAA
jgi:uncharacterized membrane protein YhaH (DUF805 family)